ncbi:MAG: capsule biosynthesis protein CapA [Pseudomonadota bacterium]
MRRFLFLQGPHGPFFAQLARSLRASGAEVERVLFNRGDRLYWRGPATWFVGSSDAWPDWIAGHLAEREITDLVLYGDTRRLHADAIPAARKLGLRVHVFEEGYLRPWWVTYEREGSNGNSPLIDIPLDRITAARDTPALPVEAPEGWGALYRHMGYGASYHAAILSGGPSQPSHREVSIRREAVLNIARLITAPVAALGRRFATWRLSRSAAPYHLVLLQLDHDANFRNHGPFRDSEDFVTTVLKSFASGARRHHRLVFKAHPLEDGRVPLGPLIRRKAADLGVSERVHYIPGGKLATLLDKATTAVAVNSTAAQQALFRGLPLRAFGRSVYARSAFVSDQPLRDFFADPHPPDREAYAAYRQFLLETSQVPGSYYSAPGRRQLCRRLVDMMLADTDAYAARLRPASAKLGAAAPQHLALVRSSK